jgi:hypothetical protein
MKKALARIGAVALVLVVVVSGFGVAMAQDETGEGQSDLKVLAVRAPGVVQVHETVTITVVDRDDGTPVPAASVYALTWPDLTASSVAGMWYGCEFLGKTDNAGEITHTFERAGRVLLVATKEGWGPGLARMTVKPNVVGKLVIESPRRAKANDPVTIKVSEKNSGDAVAGADLWAVRLPWPLNGEDVRDDTGQAEGLLEELRLSAGGNITDVLSSRGIYLGQTNGDGELVHPFSEVGVYLLVATKTGYVPGCRLIVIVPEKELALNIEPSRPDVGEEVTFTVTERGTSTPVADVDLYAVESPFRGLLRTLPGILDGNRTSLKEMLTDSGFQIGTTDGSGQCTWTFDEAGGFIIVGVKDGYIPALGFVRVGGWPGLQQLLPRAQRLGENLGQKGPVALQARAIGATGSSAGLLHRLAQAASSLSTELGQ